MTALQKAIVISLLEGGNIANAHKNGYRLRTAKHSVISKFMYPTFHALSDLLRKEKRGLYVIDKNKVRQLRGNAWAKKEYKKIATK